MKPCCEWDLCIMSSMKCLSTVVRYVRVDFNERNDVWISYIEMHVNFDVFKIRIENSRLSKNRSDYS